MSYKRLAQAQLTGEHGTITVYFNPKELSVEKQVQWTQKEGAVSDEPPQEFTKPTPATLTVTLHFDRYEDGGSALDDFNAMMKLANIGSQKRPPLYKFVYGSFVFEGVTESLSTKMTMFDRSGKPVRMEATLKMKKASKALTGRG
ncbi:MAG: hypothetical protein RMK29_05065 [Myxococcales bacterium]|nr:phage tail protein [Myxococcota bacterium]MDW8281061.1 hypothetical protein [Myxococcales bacterium]